ncbi:MAG: TlpA family protein disulfide reductase [Acidiferrobacterales bacterium]
MLERFKITLLLILFLTFSAFTTGTVNAAVVLPKGIIKIDPIAKAPGLRLANADGEVTDLRDLRGNWVMVHFWASWCGPCRKELPSVQRMAQQVVPKEIKLVMVNTAENEDDIISFLFGVAPDLDTLMDSDGVVTNLWQPRGLPSSFFVDPDGRIRFLALGGRPWDTKPYLDFIRSLAAR